MTDTTTSAIRRSRFTHGQQRLLDIVATAIVLRPLSNAPQLLASTSQPFLPIPITLLVLSVILAGLLYRGDRRFLLPACIPPIAVLAGHIHLLTRIPATHSDDGWHLTPGRYLLDSSPQIVIAVFCLLALLYVFNASRSQSNVA